MLARLAALPMAGIAAQASGEVISLEDVDGLSGATQKWLEQKGIDDLEGQPPKAKIKTLEMSRLILGNNLIGGWAHSRDLIYVPALFKAYNTEQKVFETLFLAEAAGVDTMMLVNDQYPVFQKYMKVCGGKMQTMYQTYPSPKDITTDINKAIDNGATTLYLQGAVCDRLVKAGQIDVIAKALDHAKQQGYVAGIGAHSIRVPMACEEAGLDPDYYVKTSHHDQYWSAIPRESREEFSVDGKAYLDHDKFHDNIFDLFPEQTVEFMATVKKPWVAFKVLAGGAIHPRDGFEYAFRNGADFICVGMFDFQIIDDVNIVRNAIKNSEKDRTRPWYA